MDVGNLVRNEGLRRGTRPETIKTYIYCLNKFFRVCHKNPLEITKRDITDYVDYLHQWNRSDNTINVYINALKFFYENVLNKKLTLKIEHKRVRKQLPTFLTKEETQKLFDAIGNFKHKLMVKMLYATGMRVSELVSLKVKDFEFNENYGWVREGKGGKDRLFVIAVKLKKELLEWIAANKLNADDWLFPGQGNTHVSIQTIQLIIKIARKKAKITKNVHPHTLRHSFATHLIENGYAVTEVQPLLGHNSLNTTMIYLHMASPELLKVKSPYDSLDKKGV
ncbi:MAG: tyrosine-type recombinase/integrase [Nanoarchaeota archaeon]|nr:tyrosine-type recombinase/integrase [Nanoarchaeota archaeon]MBU1631794.1 tyrosine-type recombinase/integrase [Nanoarchaeota archaeon]MBU1876021.1 tyrosine-type recombinase/integrase [Nanoarchaeota archaeon]